MFNLFSFLMQEFQIHAEYILLFNNIIKQTGKHYNTIWKVIFQT